jgi:hypothetical protein
MLRVSEMEGGYRCHIRSKGGGMKHGAVQWERVIAQYVNLTVAVRVDRTIPPHFIPF